MATEWTLNGNKIKIENYTPQSITILADKTPDSDIIVTIPPSGHEAVVSETFEPSNRGTLKYGDKVVAFNIPKYGDVTVRSKNANTPFPEFENNTFYLVPAMVKDALRGRKDLIGVSTGPVHCVRYTDEARKGKIAGSVSLLDFA